MEAIRFQCPNCEARIQVNDAVVDHVACPQCETQLLIPDPTAVPDYSPGDVLPTEEAPIDYHSSRHAAEAEMDMTPMVDVTFLLLIFFMVTAAFSMQKSFEVPTPQEERPSSKVVTFDDFEQDPEFVIVRIDENDTYFISTASWDEEREAPSLQDLFVGLNEAIRGGSSVPSQLLVVAHGNATHEKVVTAMDAGSEVGIQEVKLVTVEEDPT